MLIIKLLLELLFYSSNFILNKCISLYQENFIVEVIIIFNDITNKIMYNNN